MHRKPFMRSPMEQNSRRSKGKKMRKSGTDEAAVAILGVSSFFSPRRMDSFTSLLAPPPTSHLARRRGIGLNSIVDENNAGVNNQALLSRTDDNQEPFSH